MEMVQLVRGLNATRPGVCPDDFEFSDDDFEDSSDDEDALVAFMREGASGAGDGRENTERSDGDEDDESE